MNFRRFRFGGESTHAVLTGHRGLASSKLFTDLDQVKKDDMFYIYVLDEVLAYQVDKVEVVEPSELDSLNVVEGEDYVTLVTCTPYGINTHRLLVRGTRVEFDEEVMKSIEVEKKLSTADIVFLVGILFVGLILVVVFFVVGGIRKKERIRKIRQLSRNEK